MSAEHLSNVAMRAGSPRFMLHDLRKLVATVGEKLDLSSAVMRRILNHTAPKTDVLHRHYVGLGVTDVTKALVQIQQELVLLLHLAIARIQIEGKYDIVRRESNTKLAPFEIQSR